MACLKEKIILFQKCCDNLKVIKWLSWMEWHILKVIKCLSWMEWHIQRFQFQYMESTNLVGSGNNL